MNRIRIKNGMLMILLCASWLLTATASSHNTQGFPVTLAAYTLPVGSVIECEEAYSVIHISNYPILFIGDSRTVGMQNALTHSGTDLSYHSFLSKVGAGYSYLTQMSKTIEQESATPHIIVINMGVNDLDNCKRYVQLYADYHTTIWKDCPVYIVSVNPVAPPCHSVSNARIEQFNREIQEFINTQNASADAETFPIRYIDTYSYLQSSGFGSRDGLHYSASTYLSIYRYIMDSIEEPVGDGSGWYETSKLSVTH